MSSMILQKTSHSAPWCSGFNSIYSRVRESFEAATGYIIDYHMVEELVWRLMINKQIESRGACQWWGDPAYNNMLFTQSFRLSRPQAVFSYTYDDALEIVCDAFQYGDTYPLFDLLDDNVTLTFVDEGESVSGKREVVAFIENDGLSHVQLKKERVFCDILRVEEGERYGVGEWCILLCYEQDDAKRQDYIVKVDFESNKVVKIEVFHSVGPFYIL